MASRDPPPAVPPAVPPANPPNPCPPPCPPPPPGPAPAPGPGGVAGFGLSPIRVEVTIGAADPAKSTGLFSTLHNAPPQTTTTTISPLPTDVATLQSRIDTLQAELRATTHLAASVARLQAEQATPTPIAPTTTTPTPIPCLHPDHPRTIASGRGAASPEVFKQMCKTNWHGRLGRAHMVDVDALPPAALMELDGLVRRKLRGLFPRGVSCTYSINPDEGFGGLAALGLRLEDRDRYMCQILADSASLMECTTRRARNLAGYYYANEKYTHNEYMRGYLVETLVELGRYRGLFDDEGFLGDE